MEDSVVQQKIISLGETIVNELKLDPGVDTLSKWMAHYVAEKIEIIKTLKGQKKKKAEKECFEIMLNLWEQRWSGPEQSRFLGDFEPLLETLYKLNPDREKSFYLRHEFQILFQEENQLKDKKESNSHYENAIKIDRIARRIIANLLFQSVSEINLTGKKGKLVRNLIDLLDYPDTSIIRIVSEYDKRKMKDKSNARELVNKQIKVLEKRIEELEEFGDLRNLLLENYKNELRDLERVE